MGDFDLNEIQESINPKKEKTLSKFHPVKVFKIAVVIFLVVVVVWATNYIYSLKYRNREDIVNIGYVEKESVVLFTIADELKYFEDSGIKVDLREFENNADLIKAWEKGRLDLLVIEDIGLVLNLGSLKSSRIISSVAKYDTYKYIVDLKKSIYKISDLDSRTIGVAQQESSSFWFESGLQNNGVNRQTITIVDLKPKQLGEKLANGNVDAVFAKDLDAYETLKFSNTEIQAIGLSAHGEIKANALLVATEEYIRDNNSELHQVFTTLARAKEYYDGNKENIVNILIAKWSVEKGYVSETTNNYNYDLVLDSKIIELLDSEVNWARSRGKMSEPVEIQPLINYSFLRKVKPENVTF